MSEHTRVLIEWRASALHPATKSAGAIWPKANHTGSAFTLIDELTGLPPTKDRLDSAVSCYVTVIE